MDKHIKKAWLRLLRGNDYIQMSGMLRDGPRKRCCLGVLCDIADKDNVGEWDYNSFRARADGLLSAVMPPDAVLKWAGLTLSAARRLAAYNDEGHSFKDIAQIIDINY